MKRKLALAAAAALLTVHSCNETAAPEEALTPCSLSVAISSPSTRATVSDTDSEAKVSSLDAFVFRGDVVDAYGKSFETSVKISATQGDRTIYAVVNSENDISTVSSLSGIKKQTSLLKNNSRDKFVMTGSIEKNLGATSTATVDVRRIAARFKIDKITNELENSAQAAAFAITRIYLTNVSGEANYEGASTGKVWYATQKLNASDAPNSLIYNKLPSIAKVSPHHSYTTSHSFYAYPNNSSDKNTLLVVEANIAGSFYTYPIMIAGTVERNKSYEISELIIKHLGNTSDGDDDIEGDENKPIQTSSVSVGVNVLDWDQVLVGDNGTITL